MSVSLEKEITETVMETGAACPWAGPCPWVSPVAKTVAHFRRVENPENSFKGPEISNIELHWAERWSNNQTRMDSGLRGIAEAQGIIQWHLTKEDRENIRDGKLTIYVGSTGAIYRLQPKS